MIVRADEPIIQEWSLSGTDESDGLSNTASAPPVFVVSMIDTLPVHEPNVLG